MKHAAIDKGLGKERRFQAQSMGSRLARLRKFSRPEQNLRSVMSKAPQAEAFAVSWLTRVRPAFARAYTFRRRIATMAVTVLAVSLFVHVMFGANGMVVYRQKRAEYQALQKQIGDVQRENDSFTRQIQGLKSDVKTIEKEAREQLGYARPGEYVYIAPAPAKPAAPPANHSAKN
jgi:cell division protein FtsB